MYFLSYEESVTVDSIPWGRGVECMLSYNCSGSWLS